jgi:hypothetical protein
MSPIFAKIRAEVEEAIIAARDSGMDDAVNWADLHCIRVEKCEEENGDIRYRATVEEASPMAEEFQMYVSEYIYDKTGLVVDIVTEW